MTPPGLIRSDASLLGLAFLLVFLPACGGGAQEQPASSDPPTTTGPPTVTTVPAVTITVTTTTTSTTTTTTEPPDSPQALTTYRFRLTVGLTDEPGTGAVRPLSELSGETTSSPAATRIFGTLRDQSLDLVTDGTSWWDLDDPTLDISPADIEGFLGGNGFLLPESIAVLLDDQGAWTTAGVEEVLGLPATFTQRHEIVKDRDWPLGDLTRLDVWHDELGQLVKFTAWFATGDNAGFPVATWELTERNPAIQIELPA